MSDPTDALENRLMELEVKLAYQDETVSHLNAALVDKERRISALEDQVARLEKALQILAERQRRGAGPEVEGKMDVDDPVPRSG
jgi:uncharacterized coiled-coil protein SlyX